jgi:hypothetical protein
LVDRSGAPRRRGDPEPVGGSDDGGEYEVGGDSGLGRARGRGSGTCSLREREPREGCPRDPRDRPKASAGVGQLGPAGKPSDGFRAASSRPPEPESPREDADEDDDEDEDEDDDDDEEDEDGTEPAVRPPLAASSRLAWLDLPSRS